MKIDDKMIIIIILRYGTGTVPYLRNTLAGNPLNSMDLFKENNAKKKESPTFRTVAYRTVRTICHLLLGQEHE